MTPITELKAQTSMRYTTVSEITEAIRKNYQYTNLVEDLKQLPEKDKIDVIQQFFNHTQAGSHQTTFDRSIVAHLLKAWFSIDLHRSPQAPRAISPRPGQSGHSEVCHVDFAGTDLYFWPGSPMSASIDVFRSILQRAILTIDATSPPCPMSEFVPLWLTDRNRPSSEYYVDQQADHPIAAYFSNREELIASELEVNMRCVTTEMAIIPNGDALRYHRDRLVSQYAEIDSRSDAQSYQVVQELSLIDWDMQEGTYSGTILDHPTAGRFILVLEPNSVSNFFFSEPVTPPGPMMMPYHCALPVLDRDSRETSGTAKGKRLSALLRGIAPVDELQLLHSRAASLALNDCAIEDGVQCFSNGITLYPSDPSLVAEIQPTAIRANDDCLSIFELSTGSNRELLSRVVPEQPENATILRIEKYGDGFSKLDSSIPELASGEYITIINRSTIADSATSSFAITLDWTLRGFPWLQLLPLPPYAPLIVPRSEVDLVTVTPPDEILHRSAAMDSFLPGGSVRPRLHTAVDLILL